MNFTADKLKQARDAGYSDDEIWGFASEQDNRFTQAKDAGYSLDEVSGFFSEQPEVEQPEARPTPVEPQVPVGTSIFEEIAQVPQALKQAIGQPLEAMGETAEVLGAPEVGATLRGAIEEPKGYVPAAQRFMQPQEGEFQIGGFAPQFLPRAIVEQAGQLAGAIGTRAAGGLLGGIVGTAVGPKGTVAGAVAGQFIGPALFEMSQVVGPVARERAANQGREQPNADDLGWAWATAGASGALNAIGARYLPNGDKLAGGLAKRISQSFIGEGIPEGGQAAVQQIGETFLTEQGLDLRPKEIAGEALIGGGAGAAAVGVAAPFTKAKQAAETKVVAEQAAPVAPETAQVVSEQANQVINEAQAEETAETPEQRVARLQEEATAAAGIELEEEGVGVEPTVPVTPPVEPTPEGAVAPVETPEIVEKEEPPTPIPTPTEAVPVEKPTVAGFTTAQGSTYEVTPEGKTVRTKQSEGVGQGQTFEPHSVLFVQPEASRSIMEDMQSTAGNTSTRIGYIQDNQFVPVSDSAQIPADAEPTIATVDRRNNAVINSYTAQRNPETGLSPVEKLYKEDGTSSTHIGNQITEIRPLAEAAPAVTPPAEATPEVTPTPETPNLEPLRRVARAEQAPEDIPSLVEAGLVEVYKDQPVLTDAGLAALPEAERPRLNPEARKIQIDTGANEVVAEAIAKNLRIGVDQVGTGVRMPAGWTLDGDIYVPPAPQEVAKAEEPVAPEVAKPTRKPRRVKDTATMTAGEINKELDRLRAESSKITDEFIAAGRGEERPSEYLKKTDPLSVRAKENSDRMQALRGEIRMRYGADISQLPTGKGFGPRARPEPETPPPTTKESVKVAQEILNEQKKKPSEQVGIAAPTPLPMTTIPQAQILPSEQSDKADAVLAISKKNNFYTLWFVRQFIDGKPVPPRAKSFQYLTILSTDPDEAVRKANVYASDIAGGQSLSVAFSGKNLQNLEGAKTVAILPEFVEWDKLSTPLRGAAAGPMGEQAVGFGKYRDIKVDDLYAKDSNYVDWLMSTNPSNKRVRDIVNYLRTSSPELQLMADVRELEGARIRAYEDRESRRKGGEQVPVSTLVRREGQIVEEAVEQVAPKPKAPKLTERKAKDQMVDIVSPRANLPDRIAPNLKPQMYPIQVDGANAVIDSMDRFNVALNGDGAGVGKTRQIIAVADHYAKQGKPVVIVTENAAIGKPWEGRKTPILGGSMAKDSEAMGVTLNLLTETDKPADSGSISITTYNRVTSQNIPTGAIVIFDESQNLANTFGAMPDERAGTELGQWQIKFRDIFGRAERTAFYSATPADKPHQLAYLYKVLGFNSPEEYLSNAVENGTVIKTRRFGSIEQKYYDVPSGKNRKANLYKWVNGIMTEAGNNGRFIKREISYEGTDVQFHDVKGTDLEKNPWAKPFLDALAQMSSFQAQGYLLLAPNSYVLYGAELTKIGDAVKIAKRELDAGRKIVIYFSRINDLKIRGRMSTMGMDGRMELSDPVDLGIIPSPVVLLRDELKKEGIKFTELHGKSGTTSQKAQKEFAGPTNVLLASVESGGTGINLDDTTGNEPRTEIFMFSPYRGISTIQAMGRIWRASTIQNDNKPNRFVFATASDIDADASRSAVLAKKLQLMNASLGGTAVSRLPMSKTSYDPSQLVGIELPEEGVESAAMAERTGVLMPVDIKWSPTRKGGFYSKATADLLEWMERGGPDRTGINVSVFKSRDSGEWVALADKEYKPEDFVEKPETPPPTPPTIRESRRPKLQMPSRPAGMETEAVATKLESLGFGRGGIVSVVNEPDASFEGRTIIRDGKVVAIELNAAALKDDTAIERVLNHEIAESANADGALNKLVAGLTPKERKEINDAITRLGYAEKARTAEEAARAVELLAEGWRGRKWFERAVARVEAWANKLGYKLTRRAAEYIAARNVSEINAEFKQAYNKFINVQGEVRESRREDAIPTFSEGSPEASTLSNMKESMAKVDAASEAKGPTTYKISEIASVWMDQGGDVRQLQDLISENTNLTPANAQKVANAIAKQYDIQQSISTAFLETQTGLSVEALPEGVTLPKEVDPDRPRPVMQRLFDVFMGVRVKPVKITGDEKALLKSQIRLKAAANRAAKQEQQRTADEVVEIIKSMELRGPVRPKQAQALAKRAAKVIWTSEKSMESFVEYAAKVVENANYDADLREAKAAQKRAKELSKQKKVAMSPQRLILQQIGNVAANKLDDPRMFAEMINYYLRGFKDVRSPDYVVVPDEEITGYISQLETESVKDQAEVERETNERLARKYDLDPNTIPELMSLINIIEEIEGRENREALESILTDKAIETQDGLRGYDTTALTNTQKNLVESMLNVDLKSINTQERQMFIRISNNMIYNNQTNGAEYFVATAKGQQNARKAAQDSKMIQRNKAWIPLIPSFGSLKLQETLRNFSLELQSVADTFRNVFGKDFMAKAYEMMGMLDLNEGFTKANNTIDEIQDLMAEFHQGNEKTYGDAARNQDGILSEGVAGFLIQEFPFKDEATSIQQRRNLINEYIANARESRQKDRVAMADRVEAILNKVDGASVQEILNNMKREYRPNYDSLMWYKDVLFPKYKDFLKQFDENFNDQANNYDSPNYLPIAFTSAGPALALGPEDVSIANSISLQPKQSVYTIKRQDYTKLPKDKDGNPKEIEFNLRRAAFNSLSDQINKAYTNTAWQQIFAFMKTPESVEFFGDKANRDFFVDRLNRLRASRARRGSVSGGALEKALDSFSIISRKLGTGIALGGVFQWIKQPPDQLLTALGSGGRGDLLAKNVAPSTQKAARELLNLFSIGRRGDSSAGYKYINQMEGHQSRMERYFSESKWEQAKEQGGKIADVWMVALKQSDFIAASAAWMTYYEGELNKNDIKIDDWAKEAELVKTDPVRRQAAAYAEQMTDIYQGSSDPTSMATFAQSGKTGWENFTKALLVPFNSFAIQQRMRLYSDARDALNGTSGGKGGLAGTIGGLILFHTTKRFVLPVISGGTAAVLYGMLGVDMEEPDEEKQKEMADRNWRQFLADITGNLLVGGTPQIVENRVIEAFNYASYMVGMQLESETVLDENGEIMSFDKYSKERSPFYRYKSYDNAMSLGMFDIGFDQAKETALQTKMLMDRDEMEMYTPEEQRLLYFSALSEWLYLMRLNDTDFARIVKKARRDMIKAAEEREKELARIRAGR